MQGLLACLATDFYFTRNRSCFSWSQRHKQHTLLTSDHKEEVIIHGLLSEDEYLFIFSLREHNKMRMSAKWYRDGTRCDMHSYGPILCDSHIGFCTWRCNNNCPTTRKTPGQHTTSFITTTTHGQTFPSGQRTDNSKHVPQEPNTSLKTSYHGPGVAQRSRPPMAKKSESCDVR